MRVILIMPPMPILLSLFKTECIEKLNFDCGPHLTQVFFSLLLMKFIVEVLMFSVGETTSLESHVLPFVVGFLL